jgi:hypothetical protein
LIAEAIAACRENDAKRVKDLLLEPPLEMQVIHRITMVGTFLRLRFYD